MTPPILVDPNPLRIFPESDHGLPKILPMVLGKASAEPLFTMPQPAFSLGPLGYINPLWTAGNKTKPAPPTWMEFVYQLAGAIHSMDLDFYHLPVNRGSNLCRFPEYTPKAARPKACTIKVLSHTHARAHGELRPVKGRQESFITRVVVDFKPNLYYILDKLPDLEIDGFAAVDPPAMKFDRSFKGKGGQTVLSLKGGNFKYENPLETGKKLRTPFGTTAPALPQGHDHWMFRFSPINDTLFAGVQEYFADKKGQLLLWAWLPTMGLTAPRHYDDLKIPYNTFPRRLPDLLRLFSPLFDGKLRPGLIQAAPYLNPNTEYLNAQGGRRQLPEGVGKIVRLNKKRQTLGLPLLPRKRGKIIDWTFGELVKDPKRLQATRKDKLPYATARLRFRDQTLNFPMGKIKFLPQTALQVRFGIQADSLKTQRGERYLEASFKPLALKSVQLELGTFGLKAQNLEIKHVHLEIPSLEKLLKPNASSQGGLGISMKEISAKTVELKDLKGQVQLKITAPKIGKLTVVRKKDTTKIIVKNFTAKQLELRTAMGTIRLDPIVGAGQLEFVMTKDFDWTLKLKLPQVGFATEGKLSIPKNSATLKAGSISVSPQKVNIEGQLDVTQASLAGFGEGDTYLGNFILGAKSLSLKDLEFHGKINFEQDASGWKLTKSPRASKPVSAKFKLGPSEIRHLPNLEDTYLEKRAISKVIKTKFKIQGANVSLENFERLEYRRGKTGGRLNHLVSGPFTIDHLVGSADIWVDLKIWGFVRGLFPKLGGSSSKTKPKTKPQRPDPSILMRHLPKAVQKSLGSGDFFRMARIEHHAYEDGTWENQFKDLLLNLHEDGGRGQFGLIRIPKVRMGKTKQIPFFLDLGRGNYWVNLYLEDQQQGGFFRLMRWP